MSLTAGAAAGAAAGSGSGAGTGAWDEAGVGGGAGTGAGGEVASNYYQSLPVQRVPTPRRVHRDEWVDNDGGRGAARESSRRRSECPPHVTVRGGAVPPMRRSIRRRRTLETPSLVGL